MYVMCGGGGGGGGGSLVKREREREGGGERGQYLVVPIVVLYLLPGIRVYLAVVCSGWLL